MSFLHARSSNNYSPGPVPGPAATSRLVEEHVRPRTTPAAPAHSSYRTAAAAREYIGSLSSQLTPAQRHRRERRIKLARLWNDEIISTKLLSVTVSYFTIGFISVVAIVMALLVGMPAQPLGGTWPTYGWQLLLGNVAMFIFVPIALHLWSGVFVRITTGFVAVAVLLDAFAFGLNVYWLGAYWGNALSPVAANHQPVFATIAFAIIYLFLLRLSVPALFTLVQVIQILPDLKAHYNIRDGDEDAA